MSENLFQIIEIEERPAVIIKLNNDYDIVAELKKERGIRKPILKLTILQGNEVRDWAEIPYDRIDKIKQPRYDTFRYTLRQAIGKEVRISEFQAFLKAKVIPLLADKLRKSIEMKRKEREERLAKEIEEYKDEIEKIKNNPIEYALDVLKYRHVGDEDAKKKLLLVVVSRKLPREDRLHAVIYGPQSVGKNHLVSAIRRITPKKWWFVVTRLTPKAIDYMPKSLGGQILYIQEYEGLRDAAYSVRITISEGELIIYYVAKDPQTGKMKTVQRKIKGTPIVITTTTRVELDPDMASRTVFINLDTSQDQTKRILEYHTELATNIEMIKKLKEIERKERALRIFFKTLKKYRVLLPEDVKELLNEFPLTIRARRDWPRVLAFIKAHAVLNQYRRSVIEVDGEEILLANEEDIEFVKKFILEDVKKQSLELLKIHEEVLKVVIELIREGRSFVTVRDVHEKLRSYSRDYVRKILESLVDRGFLIVDTKTKPYRYMLTIEENQGLESYFEKG